MGQLGGDQSLAALHKVGLIVRKSRFPDSYYGLRVSSYGWTICLRKILQKDSALAFNQVSAMHVYITEYWYVITG